MQHYLSRIIIVLSLTDFHMPQFQKTKRNVALKMVYLILPLLPSTVSRSFCGTPANICAHLYISYQIFVGSCVAE